MLGCSFAIRPINVILAYSFVIFCLDDGHLVVLPDCVAHAPGQFVEDEENAVSCFCFSN